MKFTVTNLTADNNERKEYNMENGTTIGQVINKYYKDVDFEEYDITINEEKSGTALTTMGEVSFTSEEKDNLIKEYPYLEDMDVPASIPLEDMLKRKIKEWDAIILA